MVMKKGTGWDEIETSSGSEKYYDCYDRKTFPKNEYYTYRLAGEVYKIVTHWIPARKKSGGDTAFPVMCNEFIEEGKCGGCQAGIRKNTQFISNAIDREEQEKKPSSKRKLAIPKDTKFKKPGDAFWSPIVALQFPDGAASNIKNLKELNKHMVKGRPQSFSMEHPKYGCDLHTIFDPTSQGAGMYQTQKAEVSPLTKEEKAYLLYDLSQVYTYPTDQNELFSAIKRAYEEDLFKEDSFYSKKFDDLEKYLRDGLSSDNEDEDNTEIDLDNMSKKELIKFMKAKDIVIEDYRKMDEDDLREAIEEVIEDTDVHAENGEDTTDDISLDEMDKDELIGYMKDHDITIKRYRKLDEDDLREAIEEAIEDSVDSDEDENSVDIDEMDKKELIKFIKSKNLKIKNYRKMDEDELRDEIEEALEEQDLDDDIEEEENNADSEEDLNDDTEEEDDIDEMDKEELIEYMKKQKLKIKNYKKLDEDDLRYEIEEKMEEQGEEDEEDIDEEENDADSINSMGKDELLEVIEDEDLKIKNAENKSEKLLRKIIIRKLDL